MTCCSAPNKGHLVLQDGQGGAGKSCEKQVCCSMTGALFGGGGDKCDIRNVSEDGEWVKQKKTQRGEGF